MRPALVFMSVLVLAAAAFAQRFFQLHHDEGPRPEFPASAEFHFLGVEYTALPQYHRRFGFASRGADGEGWWMVDWPDADEHFAMGVQRLTRIHTGTTQHLR